MGLMKISGLPQTSVPEREYQYNTDPPRVAIYDPAMVIFKYYASKLLALTALTDPTALDKIREAAEAIETTDEENWTQSDAETILAAAGAPPAPSYVVVTRVQGHAMVLVRAVPQGTKRARKLRYQSGSARPTISLLSVLRAEGMVTPQGMCMEVPVKLVEDDQGLALALMLRRQQTRSLAEAE